MSCRTNEEKVWDALPLRLGAIRLRCRMLPRNLSFVDCDYLIVAEEVDCVEVTLERRTS